MIRENYPDAIDGVYIGEIIRMNMVPIRAKIIKSEDTVENPKRPLKNRIFAVCIYRTNKIPFALWPQLPEWAHWQ
jgi:hypothetical protein